MKTGDLKGKDSNINYFQEARNTPETFLPGGSLCSITIFFTNALILQLLFFFVDVIPTSGNLGET